MSEECLTNKIEVSAGWRKYKDQPAIAAIVLADEDGSTYFLAEYEFDSFLANIQSKMREAKNLVKELPTDELEYTNEFILDNEEYLY